MTQPSRCLTCIWAYRMYMQRGESSRDRLLRHSHIQGGARCMYMLYAHMHVRQPILRRKRGSHSALRLHGGRGPTTVRPRGARVPP